MLILGSLSATNTSLLGYAPALAVVYFLAAAPWYRLPVAGIAACASAVLVAIGALSMNIPWPFVGQACVVLMLVGLAGLVRRQNISRQEAERVALAQQVEVEREHARAAVLEERNRIARDLHDVLAHTLGGLTIQLGAVDAELAAGRVQRARQRAQSAQRLSSEGLAEARRAVAALRGEDTDVAAAVQRAAVSHRSLGGTIDVVAPHTLIATPEATQAISRAAQELLTNARRHAPGVTATITLARTDEMIELTVATPRGDAQPHSPGSGLGLRGLHERIQQLRGSVTVDTADPFTVRIEVPT